MPSFTLPLGPPSPYRGRRGTHGKLGLWRGAFSSGPGRGTVRRRPCGSS